MRAIRFDQHGEADVLRIENINRPTPERHSVLVEVRAVAINPLDITIRRGHITPNSLPCMTGTDLAGVVIETGESVKTFDIGDRVFGTGFGPSTTATMADFVSVPTSNLAHIPRDATFQTAAGAGHASGTAYRALVDVAGLNPNQVCLIHGGSGGVGHIAVQIADYHDAKVITTAGTESHRKRALNIGADYAFDYDDDDLETKIIEVTDSGVDVILDHMLDTYLPIDISVANRQAKIVSINGEIPSVHSQEYIPKEIRIQGLAMDKTEHIGLVMRNVAKLLEKEHLKIKIAQVFEFDEIEKAHRMVSEESYFGRVVVTI